MRIAPLVFLCMDCRIGGVHPIWTAGERADFASIFAALPLIHAAVRKIQSVCGSDGRTPQKVDFQAPVLMSAKCMRICGLENAEWMHFFPHPPTR